MKKMPKTTITTTTNTTTTASEKTSEKKSIRNKTATFELLIILLTLAYKWSISLNSYSGL